MDNIKDVLKEYKIEKNDKKRDLPEWQVWALDFCKKYSIGRKDYGRVMSIAKQYKDRVDYLRYLDGWLSDYPNIRGNVLKLFFWKIKEDGQKRKKDKEDKFIYM